MITTSDRVRALRLHSRMSQIDLGAAIGLSYGQISAIETGRNVPYDTVNLIAAYFKVDAKWLHTGEGQAPPGVMVAPSKAVGTAPDPWKDEAYAVLKSENERLWALVQHFTGVKNLDKSFLEALVVAGAKGKVVKLLPTHAQARAQRA